MVEWIALVVGAMGFVLSVYQEWRYIRRDRAQRLERVETHITIGTHIQFDDRKPRLLLRMKNLGSCEVRITRASLNFEFEDDVVVPSVLDGLSDRPKVTEISRERSFDFVGWDGRLSAGDSRELWSRFTAQSVESRFSPWRGERSGVVVIETARGGRLVIRSGQERGTLRFLRPA